jgi:hypothetical protein
MAIIFTTERGLSVQTVKLILCYFSKYQTIPDDKERKKRTKQLCDIDVEVRSHPMCDNYTLI